jgi:hypothetical protein
LVERRRHGQADEDILRSLPDLTPADLATAWEYAAAHPHEIERCLWENEVCMVEPGGKVPSNLVQRGRQLDLSDEEIRNAFEPPLSQDALKGAVEATGEA